MTTKSITFTLPEDDADFEVYNKAYKMHSAIMEFLNYLRQQIKYGDKESVEFEELREKFVGILNENEVGELF